MSNNKKIYTPSSVAFKLFIKQIGLALPISISISFIGLIFLWNKYIGFNIHDPEVFFKGLFVLTFIPIVFITLFLTVDYAISMVDILFLYFRKKTVESIISDGYIYIKDVKSIMKRYIIYRTIYFIISYITFIIYGLSDLFLIEILLLFLDYYRTEKLIMQYAINEQEEVIEGEIVE